MKTAIEMALEAKLIQVSEFGVIGPFPETLEHFAALVRADENEACAQLCEELGEKGYVAEGCAAAIRARGKK